jgi:hypothetical protein
MGATRVAFCIRRAKFFFKTKRRVEVQFTRFSHDADFSACHASGLYPPSKIQSHRQQRGSFPNGQLTNDIVSLRNGFAIGACSLTAKGKLSADLSVAATTKPHFLDAESALRESLAGRLEKYIIADDVTLKDVTDEFGLYHLLGPQKRPLAFNPRGHEAKITKFIFGSTEDRPRRWSSTSGWAGNGKVPNDS